MMNFPYNGYMYWIMVIMVLIKLLIIIDANFALDDILLRWKRHLIRLHVLSIDSLCFVFFYFVVYILVCLLFNNYIYNMWLLWFCCFYFTLFFLLCFLWDFLWCFFFVPYVFSFYIFIMFVKVTYLCTLILIFSYLYAFTIICLHLWVGTTYYISLYFRYNEIII